MEELTIKKSDDPLEKRRKYWDSWGHSVNINLILPAGTVGLGLIVAWNDHILGGILLIGVAVAFTLGYEIYKRRLKTRRQNI